MHVQVYNIIEGVGVGVGGGWQDQTVPPDDANDFDSIEVYTVVHKTVFMIDFDYIISMF